MSAAETRCGPKLHHTAAFDDRLSLDVVQVLRCFTHRDNWLAASQLSQSALEPALNVLLVVP